MLLVFTYFVIYLFMLCLGSVRSKQDGEIEKRATYATDGRR